MNYEEQYKLLIFNYYILFKAEQLDVNHRPIMDIRSQDYSCSTHLWNNELNNIIPGLWYILHLPRMGLDVTEMNIQLILSGHDEPHNIIPIPYCMDNKMQNVLNKKVIINPTLIICEDELYETVIKDSTIAKGLLDIVKVSDISSELLHEHWCKLGNHIHRNLSEEKICVIDKKLNLTNYDERGILPLIPMANQFGFTQQIKEDIDKLKNANNSNKFNVAMHRYLMEIAFKVSKENDWIKRFLSENINFRGIPLVITIPGIMSHQIKKTGRMKDIPINEREIINIMGYHRAMAKNALYVDVDCIAQELFLELAKLEEHCQGSKINNSFVWKTLRKMGVLLNNEFKKFDLDIIKYVSQITIFSDFPIGIVVFPNYSAPLCCIKPIIHRPLTPLTRAFQYEMGKSNQVYLGKKCKVVIAECVEKNDNIRRYCDGLSHTLKSMVQNSQDMELSICEVSSIKEFKCMLRDHADADILLVSAHGTYNTHKNMAGLVIGNEVWMAAENDFSVPPVVLLSACHVTPRGRGVVCVGDLFIRAGAKTVLGTFIPIDVRRNANLIVRLFAEIIEVRKGWSNMQTLDKIWSHVVATNAIHEILASDSATSSKLERWANTKNSSGLSPQAEFKNKYSVGRLRNAHVYEDTEEILRELAYRDGIGKYFDSVIKSQGYFPESFFYQFIGCPENIFIRSAVFEEYKKQH